MNEIEELSDGTWVVKGDTHISKWVKAHKSLACDPALFQVLEPWLTRPGVDVVWDIGANIGDHTRHYLNLGKTVVAVEPNPVAFACLEHNCPQAILINKAASDTVGPLRMKTPKANVGATFITSRGPIETSSIVMDDTELPPPDFIKIDVEGFELPALRGMETTIHHGRPIVFIEINTKALARRRSTPRDVFEFFQDHGYNPAMRIPHNCRKNASQYDALFTHSQRCFS